MRRIFSIGVPYSGGHAGQILFGPEDGYLYLMMSDGSNLDDPYNFAQNKRSLLGKILRIDVDNIPSKSSDSILLFIIAMKKETKFQYDVKFSHERILVHIS